MRGDSCIKVCGDVIKAFGASLLSSLLGTAIGVLILELGTCASLYHRDVIRTNGFAVSDNTVNIRLFWIMVGCCCGTLLTVVIYNYMISWMMIGDVISQSSYSINLPGFDDTTIEYTKTADGTITLKVSGKNTDNPLVHQPSVDSKVSEPLVVEQPSTLKVDDGIPDLGHS